MSEIDYNQTRYTIEYSSTPLKLKIKGFKGSYWTLDLRNKGIQDIFDLSGLPHMQTLEFLRLSGNQIKHIKGLAYLQNLKILDLSQNSITEINGLSYLHNLKALILSDNQINQIKGLEYLQNLEYLDLQKNRITQLSGLNFQSKLQTLYLGGNPVSSFIISKFGMDDKGKLYDCQRVVQHCLKYFPTNPLQQLKPLPLLSNSQSENFADLSSKNEGLSFKKVRNRIGSLVDGLISDTKASSQTNQQYVPPVLTSSIETSQNYYQNGKIDQVKKNENSKEKLEKLSKLLQVASRIKIDDLCKILNMKREDIFNLLIDFQDQLVGVKLDGDYIIVQENSVDSFVAALDDQFEDWEDKEISKVGKREEF